jgi:hypothetical protein
MQEAIEIQKRFELPEVIAQLPIVSPIGGTDFVPYEIRIRDLRQEGTFLEISQGGYIVGNARLPLPQNFRLYLIAVEAK